jgi:hypothetical protein
VGQFVDALNTSIINGLAFKRSEKYCEDDKTELLDNLHSFLEESDASPHPSKNDGTGTDTAVAIHVAEQVKQEDVLNCDMNLLSVVLLPDVWYMASTMMTVRNVLHPHGCCFHIFQRV